MPRDADSAAESADGGLPVFLLRFVELIDQERVAGNETTTYVYNNREFEAADVRAPSGNQTVVNGDTLVYDGENRVTSALDSVTQSAETYLYDGDGQRVEKSGPAGTMVYIYDALGRLAAEFATASNSSPCATCYLSSDQLGSTRLVTDAGGSVIARHDYLPFGEEVSPNATDNISQKFTGQERDSETGMDFFHARYFVLSQRMRKTV